MAVYPGAIPDIPATGWTHDQVAQEIEAIAAELGVNPSGSQATVRARMDTESDVALRPRYRTGEWYSSPYGSVGVNTPGIGNLRAAPIIIYKTQTFDRIACEVATAAAAGGTYRMGVYTDDGNGYPNTLVFDAGTVATDTTGLKEVIISQTLQPDFYWLVGMAQVSAAQMRMPNHQSVLMFLVQGSNNSRQGWSANNVADGPLPATYPAASEASAPGKILLRAA